MIPARTSSAPLGAQGAPAPFRAYGNPGISHNADAKARVAPPAALPMPTPGGAYRTKNVASPTVSAPVPEAPEPTAPSVTSPASQTPTPAPQGDTKVFKLSDLDNVWAECMRTATDQAGEGVMTWAKSVWESLRDDLGVNEKPRHLFERREEGIFGGQPASTAKRHILVKDRTIPHQVMGILSRVTPDNYEHIETELLNLPIRQSEDSEITEIVNVFFKKAIRPEDSIYAPEYARLIGSLVRHIEEKEREKDSDRGICKVIRSAVVNKCKEQYDNLPVLKELQQAAARSDDPETEGRRRDLMAKLKANINFLGQLFVNRLIAERVVVMVLYNLLWSKENRDDIADYEVEQFFTLIEVCGPKLTQQSRDQYQDHYIATLNELSTVLKVSTRTKVISMNCKDFIENGYVKRGKHRGPMKLEEYNRQTAEQQVRDLELVNRSIKQQQAQQQQQQQQQQQHPQPGSRSVLRGKLASPNGTTPSYSAVAGAKQAAAVAAAAAAAAAAPPQQMSSNDFRKALDVTINAGVTDGKNPIPAEAKSLDPSTLLEYLVNWAYSYVAASKWGEQRKKVGSVLRNACNAGTFTRPQVAEFTKRLVRKTIPEFTDVPKIFIFYCEVVEASPDMFSYQAYNTLLREIFTASPAVSFSLLKAACKAIHESAERVGDAAMASKAATPVTASPVAAGSDFNTVASTRVHFLPHILRFVGYTFADPKSKRANDDEDDIEVDDDDEELVREREEYDVVDIIRSEVRDEEILTYVTLVGCCTVYDDGVDIPSGKTPNEKVRALLSDNMPDDDEIRVEHFKNPNVSRRVLSAIFIYARFNKKLMEALMSVVVKPIFDILKINHATAVLMDLYETWLELDCRPATALDTALEQIFTFAATSLSTSSVPGTLITEIRKNGHGGHIPNTLAKLNRK